MKETFDKTFWQITKIILVVIILIGSLPFIFVRSGYFDILGQGSNIGNAINGITGPFIAIGAAFLTFLAFWVQYKSNIFQRNDIAVERFENNFFELLHIHQNIVAELTITIYAEDIDDTEDISEEQEEIFRGRDVFDGIYNHIPIEDENGNMYEGLRDIFKTFDVCDTRDRHQAFILYSSDELVQTLDHYFTFTCQILNYIDKTNVITEEEKHKYTDILRASFNVDELLLLFYHGILIDNEMKILIEKYAMLKNLRKKELGNEKALSLYADSAY